jgi:drug/metabolite transporter (DMT)-like permease
VTWVFLAGTTAILYAVHGAWSKRVAAGVGPLVAAWALFAFSLPILAGYLALQGIPETGIRFWPILAVNCVLNLGAAYLFLSALDSGDLGVAFPLLTLSPLFVVPLEFALLRELPGPWGGAGILLVVSGVYLLNFSERRLGLLAPFAALARHPGARRALVVALIWSVTGTLDRVAVLESSPAFYGVGLSAGLSVLFLPAIWVARLRGGPARVGTIAGPDGLGIEPGGREAEVSTPDLAAGTAGGSAGRLAGVGLAGVLVIHGVLFAAMFIAQMEALDRALASYVLAVKRTGAILAVLLGWLAFREGALGPRLAGAAVTVAGVIVLIVWG